MWLIINVLLLWEQITNALENVDNAKLQSYWRFIQLYYGTEKPETHSLYEYMIGFSQRHQITLLKLNCKSMWWKDEVQYKCLHVVFSITKGVHSDIECSANPLYHTLLSL